MSTLLSATGLTCGISGQTVVRDFSIEVSSGERVAILGPSGSGKTTLLNALGGLIQPQAGRVLVTGAPPDEASPLRREVGFILQNYGLLSLLTAAENVELALRAAGRPPDEAHATATDVLDRLDLAQFRDHLIDELSGGQQQRTAVARGTASRPSVLLADEPTSEQDAEHRELVVRHLFEMTGDDSALLLATHDEEVAELCDRTVVLK